MLTAGLILTFAGLAVLGWCIWRAWSLKRAGVVGEALTEQLKKLVAINLAAVFLSTIGLMLVVLGIAL